MSVHDIAADQLRCVRVLSVVLPDGALKMPDTWTIHTYPGYDPPIAPTLEGLFLDDPLNPPAAKDLRELLDVYAERYGLIVEEKPHGAAGKVGIHAKGRWQGIDLHVWGPARADVDSSAQCAGVAS